jgi:hypothetical protein
MYEHDDRTDGDVGYRLHNSICKAPHVALLVPNPSDLIRRAAQNRVTVSAHSHGQIRRTTRINVRTSITFEMTPRSRAFDQFDALVVARVRVFVGD